MNNVVLMGRLTRDPEVRWQQGDNPLCISRFTLAVDRRVSRDSEQTADFIRIVTFGRNAEFAEKYLHQGTKIVIAGRIQTGRYNGRDGNPIYTTDVVAETIEFCESKNAAVPKEDYKEDHTRGDVPDDEFMAVPDDIDDDLPFA